MDEIVIVEYQPTWPSLFEAERRRILDAVGSHIVRVEHIGSTAVPGLAAKPIIDIMASSQTIPMVSTAVRGLAELEYEDLGEHGIPGRHFFRRGRPRSHHLHVAEEDGTFWIPHLLFRDYLRKRPEEIQKYGCLKRDLAERFRTDREAYALAKTAYIEKVLRRATESVLEILPAEERDLPEILELTHRAYARNLELGFRYSGASEPMESLRTSWQMERVYKLVFSNRIAGSVRLINVSEDCLEVKRLCVDPVCQRRGLGKALLRFAEAEASRGGFRRVRLDTAKPFRELVEWYERQGYKIVGEMRFPDVNYDSVLMEKRVQ